MEQIEDCRAHQDWIARDKSCSMRESCIGSETNFMIEPRNDGSFADGRK
jgi:hypothetical protein